jgi:predicted GTPase
MKNHSTFGSNNCNNGAALEKSLEKTIEQIHRADARLFVIDRSAEYPILDRNVLPFLGESNCLILENKSDLPSSRICCDFCQNVSIAEFPYLEN